MRRRTCLSIGAVIALELNASRAFGVQIQMLTVEEAIALEHQTRSQRLRRLVQEFGIQPPPEFSEYVIPAYAMPPDFKHDTPVLRVVFPENTFFDTASSEVVASAQPIVTAMAQMMEGDVPDVAVFISGHTDNRGTEEYNYRLSVLRARSVAQLLRLDGANAPDIWSVGFGQSLPLYENSNPTNMAFNRRVEFLFAARPEAAAEWLKNQMDLVCSGGDAESKQRCLVSLKIRSPRDNYVVDPVDRQVVAAQPRSRAQIARISPKSLIAPAPRKRQIVIDLAERSYVVNRPEM